MTRRAPSPTAGELAGYFLTGDADQGLSSSWGPLTAIALGGFGGSPDPERRCDDRRFGLGPARRSPVARAREVRAALLTLPGNYAAALWAAYGPTAWGSRLDAAEGWGMATKVVRRFGDLFGVALLLPSVADGAATMPAPPATRWSPEDPAVAKRKRRKRDEEASRPRPFLTIGERYLVALSLAQDESLKAKALAVKKEAAELLRKAEAAYEVARAGQEPTRPKPKTRATTGDRRRRALVESEGA